eukprot:291794-Chlamydomonas_euryale.AAC.4
MQLPVHCRAAMNFSVRLTHCLALHTLSKTSIQAIARDSPTPHTHSHSPHSYHPVTVSLTPACTGPPELPSGAPRLDRMAFMPHDHSRRKAHHTHTHTHARTHTHTHKATLQSIP